MEYLFIDRTWQGWKRKLVWFVPAFALIGFFILYVSGFFSGGHEGRGLLEDVSDFMRETEMVSRWSYLCTQFNVLVIYVRLLFLPVWCIVIAGCVCYFTALLILRGLNRHDRDALYSVLDVTGLRGGSKH